MRESYSCRIDKWPEFVALTAEQVENEIRGIASNIRDAWLSDQGKAAPRQFEEWTKIVSDNDH